MTRVAFPGPQNVAFRLKIHQYIEYGQDIQYGQTILPEMKRADNS